MDTLQCAVVLAKLGRFPWELQRRAELGARYQQRLAEIGVPVVTVRPDRSSVWAQMTVSVEQRERVQAALQAQGVPSAVHYPIPLNRQPAYAHLAGGVPTPHADAAAARVLSLPMSADLAEADQDRVVAALAQALAATRG